MKKILLVISMMFALTACVFEKMPQAVSVDNEGDVVINFSIVVPEAQAMTKTLDTPAIDSLTVAVFDENGFFVTARQAKRTGAWGVGSEPTQFEVKLPQSTTPLNLHFVANKLTTDFDYGMETDVMTSLITTDRKDAYWQVVSVNSILQEDLASLRESLSDIPMVRNYAKIVVENSAANFALNGFRVLNAPTSGTVVPYNVNSENFQLYWEASGDKKVGCNYTELKDELYHGFMPAGFNENTGVTDLPAGDWATAPVYTYERIYDESAQKPLSILIEGVFNDSDKNISYYKVDLYDAVNGNYDVLRNIQYTVTITDVLGDGYDSADEAASNTAGNNISFSNTTNSLLNISDGNCRLFVEYVTKRVVSEDVFYLKYKFAPDITGDLTNPASYKNAIVNSYNTTGTPTNTNPLTITCNNPEGSEGSVISGWEYDQDYGTDSEGWSRIKLTPISGYTSGNWMEDLEIKSTYDVDPSADVTQKVVLSRTVKLYRLNPYELNVVCTENVAKTVGAPLTVYTEIPTDLPEDIFPLVFSIEAEALSIYPQPGRVNDLREVITMPVVSGNTIIEGNTKPSFHFDRTLTWEEYEELKKKVTNNDDVRVPSYFLTNIAESATTVHVYNEYFESGSYEFRNFDGAKFFTNLSFPDGVKLASDSETTFTFSMTTTDDVNVTLLGLKNAEGSSTFVYTPTLEGPQELTLKTIDAEGIVSVILEAEEAGYVPATLSYERAFKMSATLEGEQYYGTNKTVTLNLTTNKPGSYTVIFTEGEGENAKSEQTTITVTEDQTEAVATYTTQTFSGAISATVIYSGETQISVPGDTRNVLVLGKMTGGSSAPVNNTNVTIYNASTDAGIQYASWSDLAAGGVEVAIDGLTDQNATAVYFRYSVRSGRQTYNYRTDSLNGNQAMSGATLNFNLQ